MTPYVENACNNQVQIQGQVTYWESMVMSHITIRSLLNELRELW